MKWMQEMNENLKRGLRSWLNVLPANPYNFSINEMLDFEGHSIRNRIWFRGDSNELEQFYMQNCEHADRYKFWASKCSKGMEMQKSAYRSAWADGKNSYSSSITGHGWI